MESHKIHHIDMKNKKNILVLAVSIDDCLFNKGYTESTTPNRLIKFNELLIANMMSLADGHDEVVITNASLRQCNSIDQIDAEFKKRTGSCFPAFIALQAEIQRRLDAEGRKIICHYDDYLLADSFGNRPAGENAKKALPKYKRELDSKGLIDTSYPNDYDAYHDENYDPDYRFSYCINDPSKLSLLYAQMQRLAFKHSRDNVHFILYDGRWDRWQSATTKKGLSTFCRTETDLIPANMRLSLRHYAGADIKSVCEDIQGTGEIDVCYHTNLLALAQMCDYPGAGCVIIHIESTLTKQDSHLLAEFKTNRCLDILVGLERAMATHDVDLVADFHRFIEMLREQEVISQESLKKIDQIVHLAIQEENIDPDLQANLQALLCTVRIKKIPSLRFLCTRHIISQGGLFSESNPDNSYNLSQLPVELKERIAQCKKAY